jgi:hypothetical protein
MGFVMGWVGRHPSCLESARSLLSKLKDPLPAATEEEEMPQVSSRLLFILLMFVGWTLPDLDPTLIFIRSA